MLHLIRNAFAALPAALAGALAFAAAASAQLHVDVTVGHLNPTPVAVPVFIGETDQEKRIGSDIAGVIANNLDRTAIFRTVPRDAYIEQITNVNVPPRFADWRLIDAQALLVGSVDLTDDGRLNVDFRLWDVLAQQQLVGLRLTTSEDSWRRIAHKVTDALYERLTGEQGYFDTRIVFVDESGPKINRTKRLAIMDQDGANPSFLTDGPYMVLTPRFSPSSQQITFMSYAAGRPQVYLFDVETGRTEVLGDFPGMTFAPRFTPDGESIIYSYALNGNSDVFIMHLPTRQQRRLTDSPSIDVSPSMSPDGRRIVFNSDRGGTPQLYVMNADGSGQERISFGDGRYSAPVWSPRGDLIAFTKQHNGTFYIGVMRPDGSGERLLTGDFLVEGTTWSPNGRVIMFTSETRGENGEAHIRSIDLTGFNERLVPTPGGASDPAWSPLLQ
jgi:TolB protein